MQPNCAFISTSSVSNIRNGPVIKHKNAPVAAAGFRSLMIDSGGGGGGCRSLESGGVNGMRRMSNKCEPANQSTSNSTFKILKKSLSEKMMQPLHKKKTQSVNKVRFLILVNIMGSAGPIKFVVNEDEIVSMVIDTALKMYAREGRLPVLGSDVGNFLLYPVNAGSDALNLSETIGSSGGRNFVLCKKQNNPQMTDARSDMVAKRGNNGWRTWLNKSFVFNASSH